MVFSMLSSTAGTLVADQTNAGETGSRAVSARKCNVWWGGGGGMGLPPLSLVFEWVSSVCFELGSNLVYCIAPGHMVSSKVRPLLAAEVVSDFFKLSLNRFFESLASGECAIHDDFWKEMVFHSEQWMLLLLNYFAIAFAFRLNT